MSMDKTIVAIDPGPKQSAYVWYDYYSRVLLAWQKIDNHLLLSGLDGISAPACAIEMVACYGMPVGAEVFQTCVWIGRFTERWLNYGLRPMPRYVTRMDVKSHLCHSARAADPNVRQALIDMFGPGKELAIGKKASPGPLYGLSKDGWSALAIAVTASEMEKA